MALVVLAAVGLVTRLPLPVAVAAGLAIAGVAVAAAWPFAGTLLFIGLLFIRPEDTFPELAGMRLVLLVGSAAFGGWALQALSARQAGSSGGHWTPALGWTIAFAAIALASMWPLEPG